ncbi:type VII secretion protein EccB [Rhodococcus pyridinivorans]|uniref:type VII secretion protein EccB n=1 Tax=Rhodococcus pyridinivorans TaxID=103816 RepID=UPI002659B1B0|nr:type VII secretion protein EccB [Rhodococcus pyridinivorans]
MAPRFLTTKTQISGYRMLVRRIEQAFIRRDVRLLSSPFTAQATAYSLGAGAGALILLAGLVMSFIKPAPARGEAVILATQSGGRYVLHNDTLHPVMNLASARLITGKPDSVRTVKEAELSEHPRGLLMGIPGAPDEMLPRTDDISRWAVCSQYDPASELELTPQTATRTLLVAGGEEVTPGRTPLSDNEALIVRESDGRTERLWLLAGGFRSELNPSDAALLAALQVARGELEQAVPASTAFLDTVPVREAIRAPQLLRQGQRSTAVPAYEVGAVLSSAGLDGDSTYLVVDTGLQPIGAFAAQVLLNSGAELVSDVAPAQIASAPVVTAADMEHWPATRPTLLQRNTVCIDWTRSGEAPAQAELLALDSVPLASEARSKVVALLPARDQTPQVDYFYTAPGRGWLVQVTGQSDDSPAREQLWWVGDNGVRFAVTGDSGTSPAETVAMLGLSAQEPHLVPWSVLRLLPEGPSLSPKSASVVHEQIPVEMAQNPVPQQGDLK